MKTLKPYLKQHTSGKDAVNRTTQKNVIAVMVKTYSLDTLVSTEFFSYKTNNADNNLYEDFPQMLFSNQSIIEIDANDY